MGCAVLASSCVVREYRESPPPPVVYRSPPPPPPPPPVVEQDSGWEAVSIEPPLEQPAPVAIPWAPPPMLWDPPPPRPWFDAVWVGGHWTWWNGEWVWARGHWARPPSQGWVYSEPYYEHRGEAVVFVAGFWRPVVRVFVPPPPTLYIPLVQVRVVHVGYARPIGPHGVFVPPPPGSQPGVIVPAPVGTPPAVVLSAPPVVRPGMVVRPVSRGGVVEVVAPAGVTREGRPVAAQAPIVAHDAASVHPVVVAPPPVRNASGPTWGPAHGVGQPRPPATVGAPPVNNPVPAESSNSTVSVRPLPPPAQGQPVVQPQLRPEAMGGGERRGPPSWSNGGDRSGNEGPVIHPVPRAEVTPRPPPESGTPAVRPPAPAAPPQVQSAAPAAPPEPSQVQSAAPAARPAGTAVPPRAEARPSHPQHKAVKENAGERKAHPDARDP
jgi:hypothetical protein